MKLRALAALMLAALMISTGYAVSQTTAQSPPTGGEVRQVDLPHGRAISLSPDGALLAAYDREVDSLCVYAVEDMAEVSCADLTGLRTAVRVGDITWSPDSTRLAFGQDAFVFLRDSDLWVMDAQTGALTNLTDDGFDDSLFPNDGESDYFVDLAPAWTPDGQAITFSRTIGIDGDFSSNVIAQIPASGGEAETLATVSESRPGVFYIPGGWSPDGATFFYNVDTADRDDPQNGIWALDAASGQTRQLAGTDDPELGSLALRQVSPAGDRLLTYYPATVAQGYIGKSVQRFVDPVTGEISPIPDPVPESEIFQGSWFGAFSPDGAYLLQPNGIGGTFDYWVTNLATGESTEVAIGLERASPVDGLLSPVWASNGVVGVARDITGAYVFPIEGAGLATTGASDTPAATPVASPATGSSDAATIVGGPVQSFDLEAGRAVSMSPDGHYVAVVEPPGKTLCTYTAATMKQVSCADLSVLNAGIRTEDIVWSPDSARLAFAENVFRYFSDGDLWVMDAQTGELTDLTDDGYTDDIMFSAPEGVTYFADVAPAWTPDSQFITFSRTTFLGGQSQGNTVAQISATGGEVETFTTVTSEEPGVFYYRGGWSPDGTRFFYNVAHADSDDPDNGIWVYDAVTGESRVLAKTESADLGPLAFREISADGSRILAWYPMALGQFSSGNESFLRFVDPETGEQSALPDPTPDSDDLAGSWIATFSPDGAYLLQATGVSNDALDFWVTDLATGVSTQVASDLEQAVPIEYQLGPVWVSNGVVFVSHSIVGVYFFPIEGAGLAKGTVAPAEASPVATPVGDLGTLAVGSDATTTGIAPIFAGPDAESPVVYLLPPNHVVHILAEPVTDDEGVWYPIFDPGTQIIGYIQANLLEEGD